MIYSSYIHKDVDIDSAHNTINESVMNAEKMVDDFINRCNTFEILHIFESAEKADFYMEGATNIVEAIGAAIRNIVAKVFSFFKGIQEKVEEIMFEKKSDLDKVELLCKRNPNLAVDIKDKFKSGELDVHDWKDIADAEEKIAKVLQDVATGKLDASEGRQKVDAVIANVEKGATLISCVVGAGLAVVNIGKAVREFRRLGLENKQKAFLAAEQRKIDATVKKYVNTQTMMENKEKMSAFSKLVVYSSGAFAKICETAEKKELTVKQKLAGIFTAVINKDNSTVDDELKRRKKNATDEINKLGKRKGFIDSLKDKDGHYDAKKLEKFGEEKNNSKDDGSSSRGEQGTTTTSSKSGGKDGSNSRGEQGTKTNSSKPTKGGSNSTGEQGTSTPSNKPGGKGNGGKGRGGKGGKGGKS